MPTGLARTADIPRPMSDVTALNTCKNHPERPMKIFFAFSHAVRAMTARKTHEDEDNVLTHHHRRLIFLFFFCA